MSTDGRRWRVAVIQMTSSEEVQRNLATAELLARRGADAGAALVALPENFAYLRYEGSPVRYSQTLEGELVGWLRDLVTDLEVWLLAGSIPEKVPRRRRIRNTSILMAPTGEIAAVYRKMHLFDSEIHGEMAFRESKTVAAGDDPVVADTPLGRLGLSICYDLRFPELYRHLALRGAEILFVPSAFTAYTGRDHWMPLLQARAIENQCWVVAPAQVGHHNPRRQSHGHAAVVDPWGKITGLLGREEGVVTAEIDLDHVARVRRGLPCLHHIRPRLLGLEETEPAAGRA
jgi:deaminated glutathione amidase